MKKTLKIAMLALIGCWLAGPMIHAQVKEKKVSYAKCAYYYGPVEKKTPKGEGKLTINEGYKGIITISGTFDGTQISDAVVDFAFQGVTFKGKAFYEKKNEVLLLLPCPVITLKLSEGSLYKGDKFLGFIKDNPLVITFDCSTGFGHITHSSGHLYTMLNSRQKLAETAMNFAGSKKYEIENHDILPFAIGEKLTFGKASSAAEPLTLLFDNGSKTPLTTSENGMVWTRANGDSIMFNHKGDISDCHLTLLTGAINGNIVTHKFANGNIYEGTVSKNIARTDDLDWLANVKELDWSWEYFCDFAEKGKLTYADGSGYSGSFSGKGFNNTDKLDNSAYLQGETFDAKGNKKKMRCGMSESEYISKYNKEKSSDYKKFDKYGDLYTFRLTYPDLAIHEYLVENDKVIKNVITYNDGTKFSRRDKITVEDYKKYYSQESAPSYLGLDINGSHQFSDGLSLHQDFIKSGGDISGYVTISEKKDNGDYIVCETDYDRRYISKGGRLQHNLRVRKLIKTFDDCKIDSESYIIEYNNGQKFYGTHKIIVNGNSSLLKDKRLQHLQLDTLISYNNVVGVKPFHGEMCDPNGKIIEIYRSGSKLDPIDFERELTQVQARLDEERKREEEEKAKQQAAEKFLAELIKKHGKTAVDKAGKGEIVTGMHTDLLVLAVAANKWNLVLSVDRGDYKTYEIRGVVMREYGSSTSFNRGTIATVSVSNNRVKHIDWYGNVRDYR